MCLSIINHNLTAKETIESEFYKLVRVLSIRQEYSNELIVNTINPNSISGKIYQYHFTYCSTYGLFNEIMMYPSETNKSIMLNYFIDMMKVRLKLLNNFFDKLKFDNIEIDEEIENYCLYASTEKQLILSLMKDNIELFI